MKQKPAHIIGLVGLPGAGKTTVAKYLERKGFARVTLSDFIKEEAQKKGVVNFTREILQDRGNKMRELFGPQVLAQLALKKIRTAGDTKVVIDGVRNLYEVAFLKVENNLTLIGVNSRPRIRYMRITDRKDRPWHGTFQDFLHQEQREENLGSREIGLRVRECLNQADYLIENNKTIHELHSVIDGIFLLRKKYRYEK